MMTSSIAIALVNARVRTGDARRPWADAIIVRDETIDFVGSTAEARKRIGHSMRIIDMQGMTIVPVVGPLIAGTCANLCAYAAADSAHVVFAMHGGQVTEDRMGLAT